MAVADELRLRGIEAAIIELRAVLAALQAAQTREWPAGTSNSPNRAASSADAAAVMADVVAACSAGLSIRGAADRLGLDRNKVARLRQRAISEGYLAVSPDRDTTAGRSVHARAS